MPAGGGGGGGETKGEGGTDVHEVHEEATVMASVMASAASKTKKKAEERKEAPPIPTYLFAAPVKGRNAGAAQRGPSYPYERVKDSPMPKALHDEIEALTRSEYTRLLQGENSGVRRDWMTPGNVSAAELDNIRDDAERGAGEDCIVRRTVRVQC